jgi:hypothetical protein
MKIAGAMRGFLLSWPVVLALVFTSCGGSSSTGVPATPSPTQSTSQYRVTLIALNGSRVSGTVDLQLTGNLLAVTVDARGLEANRIHFQHIHGNHDTASTCPTAADANTSGIITVDRTLQIVGPVALSFAPYSPADKQGGLRWSHTFTLDSGVLWAITPLTQHVVVFHGMTYQGVYDDVLPVACGHIEAISA